MYRACCILALLFTTAAGAVEPPEESYFCVGESAGGISYYSQTKSWRGAVFNPDQKFVLVVKTIGSRMDVSDKINIVEVTITLSGSNVTTGCFVFGGVPHSTVEEKYDVIRCSANLSDFTISRRTNRYLSIYPIGYINGIDNNDDTPAITAGTCTRIK